MNLTRLFASTPKLSSTPDPAAAREVIDEVKAYCQSFQSRGANGRYQEDYSSDAFSSELVTQAAYQKTDFTFEATGQPIRLDHREGHSSHVTYDSYKKPIHDTVYDYECHLNHENGSTLYSRRVYDRNARGFVHRTEVVRETPGQPLEYGVRDHLDGRIGEFFHAHPRVREAVYATGATAAMSAAALASGVAAPAAVALGGVFGLCAFGLAKNIEESETH